MLAYIYAGYPALMWAAGGAPPRPPGTSRAATPTVSVVVVAHNEARRIDGASRKPAGARLSEGAAGDHPGLRWLHRRDRRPGACLRAPSGVIVRAFAQRRGKPVRAQRDRAGGLRRDCRPCGCATAVRRPRRSARAGSPLCRSARRRGQRRAGAHQSRRCHSRGRRRGILLALREADSAEREPSAFNRGCDRRHLRRSAGALHRRSPPTRSWTTSSFR